MVSGSGEQGGLSSVLGLAPGFAPRQTTHVLATVADSVRGYLQQFCTGAGSLGSVGLPGRSMSQPAGFKMRCHCAAWS